MSSDPAHALTHRYWNELVVLDTGIMVWIRPHTSGTPPQPCVCHSATLIASHSGWLMVVYGGAYDETPIDQLVALDLMTMRWTNIGMLTEGLEHKSASLVSVPCMCT